MRDSNKSSGVPRLGGVAANCGRIGFFKVVVKHLSERQDDTNPYPRGDTQIAKEGWWQVYGMGGELLAVRRAGAVTYPPRRIRLSGQGSAGDDVFGRRQSRPTRPPLNSW